MSKKFLPMISVLLIAIFLVAACAPAATPAPTTAPTQPPAPTAAPTKPAATNTAVPPTAVPPTATPKPVKITIWNQWDGAYLDAITQAFKDYTTTHPNVTIDLPKVDAAKDALKTAIPAGQGPDIFAWANDAIGEQAVAGNIVALDDYKIDKAFLSSTYEPAAVAGVQYANKIWALPETQEAIALVYNKDLVKDEFIPKDPMNFADLLDKATKFQAANPGKTLLCNQGFPGGDAYHAAPVFFGFGLTNYIDETGKVTLNTAEAVKAATWFTQIAKVSLKEESYDICLAALKEGKVGMWWTGPWAIAGVEAAKINYGIVPMGKPFVGIKTLMLTKNAVDRKVTDVAIDVMKYFTSAAVQKKLSLVNKTIPAATAALKDADVQKLAAVAGFGASANLGIPMSPSPFASAQWDPVGKAVAALWTGAQQPQAAMDAAQKAAEDAVKKMK